MRSQDTIRRGWNYLWKLVLGTLFFLISTTACQRVHEAGGREDVIIVISEEEEGGQLHHLLREILEKGEPYSLERRPFFEMEWVSPERFEVYQYRKNILLIGELERNPIMRELLTEKAIQDVISQKVLLFEKRDPWAKGQYLLVVTGVHPEDLSSLLKQSGEILFRFFEKEVSHRISTMIYKDGTEETITQHLKETYDWSLSLPKGYTISREDSQQKMIQMIHHFPDRLITVSWEEEEGKMVYLTEKEILDLRDSLFKRNFEGDLVMRDRVQSEEVNWLGKKSLRLVGYWENDEKVMGGPFISYSFLEGGRSYFLDLHLFAPGKKKWLYLLQLEEIAKTFETH